MGIPARDILDADMARWSAARAAARRVVRRWQEDSGGGKRRQETPHPGRPGVIRESWSE